MRLWTIQPVEVWTKLVSDKVFHCDPEKSVLISDADATLSFKEPYDWIVRQMMQRIGEEAEGVKYPIWAWHTRNWEHKKPDLRCCGYNEPGTKCVCIEFEIDDNKVLLSDFDGWHFVLSNGYYDQSGSEDEAERLDKWLDSLPKTIRQKEILKSWEKIFAITPLKSDWCPVGQYIQATFWELRIEQVTKTQFFKAR